MQNSRSIVGLRVQELNYNETIRRILDLVQEQRPGCVCFANVHMVMEAYDDPEFRSAVNASEIVASDGMPVVWGLRLLGKKQARRVYGPKLALLLCEKASENDVAVGFYGGSVKALSSLEENVKKKFPLLKIAYCYSPPFRALEEHEDGRVIQEINESGAKILFVGLGCPKQEFWMARHKGELKAVMIGVGAAFDFIAGTKPQAPVWMARLGLEWLFRLATEPRRLWKRYLYHNPRFIYLFGKQLIAQKLGWRRN